MGKNKKLGCLSLLLFTPVAMAMQPLDDQSLSATTGQDGISVGVNLSKVNFNQAAIIDTDGFTTTALGSTVALTSKAALVMAASQGAASPTIGVDFVQTFNADGSIVHNPAQLLNMSIDSDAGAAANGGAFANIALSLGNGVNGMRIRPFSVYLAPDAPGVISSLAGSTYTRGSIFSTGTTLKSSNIKELLRVSNNIDVKFVANNKPRMNIQLGSSPQGHLVMFGGAVDSVCASTTSQPSGCSFNLVSGTTGAKFDLQMSGKDANGFSLNGFYAGIEAGAGSIPGAVVFGNTGTSDKLNLNLNNVWLGDTIPAGSLNSSIFNGVQNGSIGNIGAAGVSATNLKMRVSGM
ncbi:MAG: pilus assembly protein FilA [Acinetobacter sp.]|nr:pilus assembly protein FilA [Acinetobacter sp.]